VLIAGAGFTGLAAALFLVRRGHSVTVVERDGPPPEGSPTDDVNQWRHPGVSQARQSHALLGRARRVLVDEAPDVVAAFLARGIHEIPVSVGAGTLDGERMLLSRRLVAEAELRRVVARERGITFLAGDAVAGLQVTTTGSVPVVTGVDLASGASVRADLVVDASGRRSALPEWFATAGLRAPVEERQDCGFFYLTRYYSVNAGCELPVSTIPASVALDYATVFALGADNDTFSLTVTLSVDDPHRSALRDPRRFEAFLHAVPHSEPWIRVGEPISDISTMSRIENRRRRTTTSSGPIAGGLVVIGDAALHTNPTLGRGISMGLMHAQRLAEVAGLVDDDPVGFVDTFSEWTDDHLGVWYDTQVAADANSLERLAAGRLGQRVEPPDTPAARFGAAAFRCAANDEVVGVAVAKMAHLFASPSDAFGVPEVAGRVNAFLATGPSLERGPDVPSRREFESLVTA
jgi:2-polyprenyl-6-methoxyphenol hydroxylase-like FAD-dependent oxidoreductase